MSAASFADIKANARVQDFEEGTEPHWDPRAVLETHTHPFALRAQVVRGDMRLSVGNDTGHLRPDDTFELERDVPRTKQYGLEDARPAGWHAGMGRTRDRAATGPIAGRLPWLMLAAALAACGVGEPEATAVYKYTGSVQCNGGGVPLAALQQQLTAGGITVLAASCGTDGKAYVAVCGAPDGAIGIFDIPAEQADRALSLSFALLGELPAAKRVPCP